MRHPLRSLPLPLLAALAGLATSGAKVSIQCLGRQVTVGKVVPRTAHGKAFAAKARGGA